MNFSDLGLSEKTIKAINEFGIKKPTTVQIDVIPSILQGKDVFTIAPQKCGKTMSYVFPLIDIISKQNKQNILIITPSSEEAIVVSDRLSVFNKYHGFNEAPTKDIDENIDDEANVIIGSPDLLVEIVEEGKIDLTNTDILIVDDINLIKKNKQLENLEKILDILPAEKQNIVYTNRRSKETQDILDRILKAPEEVKVDKAKEQEAEEEAAVVAAENKSESQISEPQETREENLRPQNDNRRNNNRRNNERRNDKRTDEKRENDRAKYNNNRSQSNGLDGEAVHLSKKHNSFGGRTPKFILSKAVVVDGE